MHYAQLLGAADGIAMAYVVVAKDHEALGVQKLCKLLVALNVLHHAVNQLQRRHRLTLRFPGHAVNLANAVR